MPGYGATGASRREIPISRIDELQRKGFSNNQIIQMLQRDGFTSTQIFDALNQANLQPVNQMGPITEDPFGQTPMPTPSFAGGSNEELIEAIIDEKWNELMKDVTKIVQWKDGMSARIDRLEQRMEDLKGQFDKLHQAVIGKVGEYDKNILEVGAEVKAMEKVFSKVLPEFTQNMAELGRITEKLKTGK